MFINTIHPGTKPTCPGHILPFRYFRSFSENLVSNNLTKGDVITIERKRSNFGLEWSLLSATNRATKRLRYSFLFKLMDYKSLKTKPPLSVWSLWNMRSENRSVLNAFPYETLCITKLHSWLDNEAKLDQLTEFDRQFRWVCSLSKHHFVFLLTISSLSFFTTAIMLPSRFSYWLCLQTFLRKENAKFYWSESLSISLTQFWLSQYSVISFLIPKI